MNPQLEASEIQEAVFKRIEKYKDRSFFEQTTMYLGVAQILEIGLKGLLVRKFERDPEKIERHTLGQTVRELKEKGLREDYISLMEHVVEFRNYLAHEMLANYAIVKSLMNGESGTFEIRRLQKGIYELEQVCFLFDWCEEHDGW